MSVGRLSGSSLLLLIWHWCGGLGFDLPAWVCVAVTKHRCLPVQILKTGKGNWSWLQRFSV